MQFFAIFFVVIFFVISVTSSLATKIEDTESPLSDGSQRVEPENDIFFQVDMQQPSENRTYWVKPNEYFRLFLAFTVQGRNCPPQGNVVLHFYDQGGHKTEVRQHWTKGEMAVISGELSIGNFLMESYLELEATVPNVGDSDPTPPLLVPTLAAVNFTVNSTMRRIKNNAIAVHPDQKDFIYLVQHHEYMDLSEMKGPDSDALVLVWKHKPADHLIYPAGDAIWRPNISLTEGRNELLQVAREMPHSEYRYFILRDGDMTLREKKDFGQNTGDPFRTFEKYLLMWEPAVGVVDFDHHHYDPEKEVDLGYNFDAIIVAYHAETLGILLPYTTRWVKESWHHCARTSSLLAALIYNEHRLQFNALEAVNSFHTPYPRAGGYEKPLLHVLGAVANYTQLETLWFRWIDSNRARWGIPKPKGNVSYFVNHTMINPCHDLFRKNPYFKEFYPTLVEEYDDVRCEIDADLSLVHALGLLQVTREKMTALETKVDQLQSLFRYVLKQWSASRGEDLKNMKL